MLGAWQGPDIIGHHGLAFVPFDDALIFLSGSANFQFFVPSPLQGKEKLVGCKLVEASHLHASDQEASHKEPQWKQSGYLVVGTGARQAEERSLLCSWCGFVDMICIDML